MYGHTCMFVSVAILSCQPLSDVTFFSDLIKVIWIGPRYSSNKSGTDLDSIPRSGKF